MKAQLQKALRKHGRACGLRFVKRKGQLPSPAEYILAGVTTQLILAGVTTQLHAPDITWRRQPVFVRVCFTSPQVPLHSR